MASHWGAQKQFFFQPHRGGMFVEEGSSEAHS